MVRMILENGVSREDLVLIPCKCSFTATADQAFAEVGYGPRLFTFVSDVPGSTRLGSVEWLLLADSRLIDLG